jgi:uncharacterized protein DUF6886
MKLWHVSENEATARFEPRANEEHDSPEALVWAIDDEHVPAYCSRATVHARRSGRSSARPTVTSSAS